MLVSLITSIIKNQSKTHQIIQGYCGRPELKYNNNKIINNQMKTEAIYLYKFIARHDDGPSTMQIHSRHTHQMRRSPLRSGSCTSGLGSTTNASWRNTTNHSQQPRDVDENARMIGGAQRHKVCTSIHHAHTLQQFVTLQNAKPRRRIPANNRTPDNNIKTEISVK